MIKENAVVFQRKIRLAKSGKVLYLDYLDRQDQLILMGRECRVGSLENEELWEEGYVFKNSQYQQHFNNKIPVYFFLRACSPEQLSFSCRAMSTYFPSTCPSGSSKLALFKEVTDSTCSGDRTRLSSYTQEISFGGKLCYQTR